MENPKVSIIVPIYNAEPYLRRCLDSILAQTFPDFEAILVDDGSTDGSGAICEEYAAKDKRFKVVRQTNQGVSVARQTGLDLAKGDYVIHADSDDWVEKNWISMLVDKSKESDADVVFCDIDKIYRSKVVVMHEDPFSNDNKDAVEKLLVGELWGGCINKLVRRNLFEKYDIKFVAGMTMWEDLYVSCLLLMNPVKVDYVPRVLYHYDFRSNIGSLCKKIDEKRIMSGVLFVKLIENQLIPGQYSDALFQKKTVVKRWAFRVGYRGRRLIDLFSEINERFIIEASGAHVWSDVYCISLFLKRRPLMGAFCYQLTKVADKIIQYI